MLHRRGTVAKEKSSAESIKDKMSNSIQSSLLVKISDIWELRIKNETINLRRESNKFYVNLCTTFIYYFLLQV